MPKFTEKELVLALEGEARLPPSLRKKYPTLHFCPDWDFMLIDNSDIEYDCCLCGFK